MKIDRQESITVEMTFDEVQDAVKAYLVKEGRCSKSANVALVIVGVELDGQTYAVGSKHSAVTKAAEAAQPQTKTETQVATIALGNPAGGVALIGENEQVLIVPTREAMVDAQWVSFPRPCPANIFARCAVFDRKAPTAGFKLLWNGGVPPGAISDEVIVHSRPEVSIYLATGEIPLKYRKA